MKLLAIAAVILASATAYAQAPGETPMAPPPAPEATPCAYSAQIPVMANRWAVGLSVGSLSIAPKDTPDTIDYPRFSRVVAGLEAVVDSLAER